MTDITLSAGPTTMATQAVEANQYRLFEWFASSVMIGMAIALTLWPRSIEAGSLRVVVNEVALVVGKDWIGTVLRGIFLVSGLVRFFALYANGQWPVIGPRLRAIGAAGGALLWSQMSFAVIPSLGEIGGATLALAVFAPMAVCEIISCYRSGEHGRWNR